MFVWNRCRWTRSFREGNRRALDSKHTSKHDMSLSVYQANNDFNVASVPTTLQTVPTPTPGQSIPFSEVSSILVQYGEEKKGGHGFGGGGHGGSHGGGSAPKGQGGGGSAPKGRGGGNEGGHGGNNGQPGHYYYNGRNYQYGYPVQYAGNRYYPRGVILPVAFGGAGGYLLAGHIYHTYSSSDTLYYSEVPTACGASGSSGVSTTPSLSGASPTCTPPGSSYSFTDGGGLVTIQQADLASAEYSTLSDASAPPDDSSSESATATDDVSSSTPASVSSISTTLANGALRPAAGNIVHGIGHQKLAILFSAVVTTGLLISLM